MDKIALLRASPLFGELGDEEFEALVPLLKVASYDDEACIVAEGDEADALFIVLEGEVVLLKELEPEHERTIAVLGPGEVFGEMGVLEGAPRSASAVARGTVRLLWIGADLLRELVAHKPAIGSKILMGYARLLSSRLRATTEQYAEAVRWALESSGLQRFGLAALIESPAAHRLALRSGRSLCGQIVRVDGQDGGGPDRITGLAVRTGGGALHYVPFHAIEQIELAAGAESA